MIKVKTDLSYVMSHHQFETGSKSEKLFSAWKHYRFRQLISALKKGLICRFEYTKLNGETRIAVGFCSKPIIETSKEGHEYLRYIEIFEDGRREERCFRVDKFKNFTHYQEKGIDL